MVIECETTHYGLFFHLLLEEEMKEKLEKIMAEKRITYYRLSKLTGISSSVFAAISTEKGRYLSFENMDKVAIALGVSLDYFSSRRSREAE